MVCNMSKVIFYCISWIIRSVCGSLEWCYNQLYTFLSSTFLHLFCPYSLFILFNNYLLWTCLGNDTHNSPLPFPFPFPARTSFSTLGTFSFFLYFSTHSSRLMSVKYRDNDILLSRKAIHFKVKAGILTQYSHLPTLLKIFTWPPLETL